MSDFLQGSRRLRPCRLQTELSVGGNVGKFPAGQSIFPRTSCQRCWAGPKNESKVLLIGTGTGLERLNMLWQDNNGVRDEAFCPGTNAKCLELEQLHAVLVALARGVLHGNRSLSIAVTMRRIFATVAILAVQFAALRMMAATYYVDGSNSSASDSNAGSSASPWKTI